MRPPRRVVVPLAALALAGTGFAAYGATGDDAVSYRTFTATTGSVEQTLDLTGAIGSDGRADLSFGTSGEVARVPVSVGDTVEQGQVIAVLDRASLRSAVDRASSDLASARAQLADDKEAQTAAVSTASTSTATNTSTKKSSGSTKASGGNDPSQPSGTSTATTAPSTTPDLTALNAQQQAVITLQSAASSALERSEAALQTQQDVCEVTTSAATPGTSDTSTDGSAAGSGGGTDGGSGAGSMADDEDPDTGEPGVGEDCTQALAAVQSAQAATASAQKSLQDAISTLTATLTAVLGDLAASPSSPSTTSTSASAGPSQSVAPGGASTDATPATTSGTARTVTAATLAEDQASIDRAKSDLASARADLRAAVVRAPAAGTVTSLSVSPGSDVSSGDTAAVVVAPGVTTVAVEVSETQAAQLKVSTPVEVTPSGASDALSGVISRGSNVPTTSTSGSEATYALDVTLDRRDLGLPEGLPAAVQVVVGSADDVVVVPASAISDGTVTTLVDGQARRVRVTTGIVGSTQVEVVSGLESGTEVVLADLDVDLPSGDGQDQAGFGGTGFPGGFGGGGGVVRVPGGNMMR